MQRHSNEALEALITAANEYAAATAACDIAAIEAAKKVAPAAHKAAMLTLEAVIINVKAAAGHVLLASAMYEASKDDKRND